MQKPEQISNPSNQSATPPDSVPSGADGHHGPVYVRMQIGGQDLIDALKELQAHAEREGTRIKSIRFILPNEQPLPEK